MLPVFGDKKQLNTNTDPTLGSLQPWLHKSTDNLQTRHLKISIPSKLCARTQLSDTAHTQKFTAHRHRCTWVVAQISVISKKVRTLQNFCAYRLQKIRGNIAQNDVL